MKKVMVFLLVLVLAAACAVPAGATDNDFNSGYVPDDEKRLTGEYEGNLYGEVLTEGYYLIGSMNLDMARPFWLLEPLAPEPSTPWYGESGITEEYYIVGVPLHTDDHFIIGYSDCNGRITERFPAGTGNAFNENGDQIKEDGIYNIFFRPNFDGGEDWYYGCIYAEPVSPVYPTEPDGDIVDEPTIYVDPVEIIPTEPNTDILAIGCRVNRFTEQFAQYCRFQSAEVALEVYDYQEVYNHYSDGTPDWVLVNTRYRDGMDGSGYGVFDEIAVFSPESYPFTLGWGVYDIYANTFYSIDKAWDMGYSDLHDVFVHIAPQYCYTVPLGDVDHDGELSIIDVTHLQRFLAEMKKLEYDTSPFEHCSADFGANQKYISDFNCDGERDITDVTAIQRHLVGLSLYPHRFTASVKLDVDNGLTARASSSFTDLPVQYRYTIVGGVHAYSDYGTDFGAFNYYDPNYEPVPGNFHITTGFINADCVDIPVSSLTKDDYFTLTVTARDTSGRQSVTKIRFRNHV